MKTFSAYELISLLGEEEDKNFQIRGKDLNDLHSILLKKNIRSDFSRAAFEELAISYPHNVKIQSQQVTVTVEKLRDSAFPFKREIKDDCLTRIVIEEWKTIKEY